MNDRTMRLTDLNLNLLRTLRSVLKHRNVTRAAEELSLTQSAVSNNLRTLRDHFQDALVVRDGRDLRLTPKAIKMVAPLDAALTMLHRILEVQRFEPRTSTQRFRVASASNNAVIAMPRLARILKRMAPGVSIQFVAANAMTSQELLTDKIDLILSPRQVAVAAGLNPSDGKRGVSAEPVKSERFVCLVNSDDPAAQAGLTREEYLRRAHASFHLSTGFAGSVERTFVEENGVGQFDRLLTSDFTILPLIAASSDVVVVVPESLARLAVTILPVCALPCPYPIPDLEQWSIWSSRRDEDPDLIWLRTLVRRVVR